MIAVDLASACILNTDKDVIDQIGEKLKVICGINIIAKSFELYNINPDITLTEDDLEFKFDSGYYNGVTDKFSLYLIETKYNKGFWYFEFFLNKPIYEYECIYLGPISYAYRHKITMERKIEPEYWLF